MANSGTKLHGKNAAIYLGAAKGSGGIKVASKTDWTLRRNRDYVDATTFGDTNRTYLAGLPNVEGTFAGMMDVSGDLLLNAATSDATQIYLYADDGGTPILIANGPGFIDGTVNASVTDAVRYTGDFRASGPWVIFEG
jgi:hypothetical protein